MSNDGVDFIVRVNGATYWQATATTEGWIPGALYLSQWRDRDVLIELATDARGNFNSDWAYWADLVLTASSTPCTYAVPPGVSVQPGGGSFQLPVTASPTCPWRAVSSVPWLTVSHASGSGNGTLSYSVAPNAGGTRTGTLEMLTLSLRPVCKPGHLVTKVKVNPRAITADIGCPKNAQTSPGHARCAMPRAGHHDIHRIGG